LEAVEVLRSDQILDVFKVEPTGFVDRLNVRCARKRGVKGGGEGTD